MDQVPNVYMYHDEDVNWWYAISDDIPGLVTGAASSDALVDRLQVLVPFMLREFQPNLGYVYDGQIPFKICMNRIGQAEESQPVQATAG